MHDSEGPDDSIRTLSSFSFPAAFSLARSLDARGSPTGTPHPRWPEAAAPAGRAGTRAIPLSPAGAPPPRRRGGAGGQGTTGGVGSRDQEGGAGSRPRRTLIRPAVVGTNGQAAPASASRRGRKRVSSRWASGSGRCQGSVMARRRLTERPRAWTDWRARRSSPRWGGGAGRARGGGGLGAFGLGGGQGGRVGVAGEAAPQEGRDPVGRAGDGADQ